MSKNIVKKKKMLIIDKYLVNSTELFISPLSDGWIIIITINKWVNIHIIKLNKYKYDNHRKCSCCL